MSVNYSDHSPNRRRYYIIMNNYYLEPQNEQDNIINQNIANIEADGANQVTQNNIFDQPNLITHNGRKIPSKKVTLNIING